MYESIAAKLSAGELVILDGGTGTDIQRRGVTMDGEFWCAMANLSDPETVGAVHQDYIRAGAEVVTANTYASSPLSFAARGREDEIDGIDRAAVRIARDAVDRSAEGPVALAGSISVMPAITRGSDAAEGWAPDEKRLRPLYRRKAEVLAEAGCDLLIMEMMRDREVSLWATEEALATGLPVWIGISVERADDGRLLAHDLGRDSLAELAQCLLDDRAAAALVMHHEPAITAEALEIMRADWSGPLGAYPEAGHFEMPDWVFREISPDDFLAHCRAWRSAGAAILGGCCGITPDHIAALSRAGLD